MDLDKFFFVNRSELAIIGADQAAKQMNFQKLPKGKGGVIFNPKIYVAYFEPLYRDFFGGFV